MTQGETAWRAQTHFLSKRKKCIWTACLWPQLSPGSKRILQSNVFICLDVFFMSNDTLWRCKSILITFKMMPWRDDSLSHSAWNSDLNDQKHIIIWRHWNYYSKLLFWQSDWLFANWFDSLSVCSGFPWCNCDQRLSLDFQAWGERPVHSFLTEANLMRFF